MIGRLVWWSVLGTLAVSNGAPQAAEPVRLAIDEPREWQVVQRTGVARGAGDADVRVSGRAPEGAAGDVWEYRLVGRDPDPAWKPLDVRLSDGRFQATLRQTPAGGWYRLELRRRAADSLTAVGSVARFGVGERFVVAGQSYATNCNDERFRVTDRDERVVAYDTAKDQWRVAQDPQPAPDGSDGGSIWPPLGDALVAELDVPVAFINVAVGATSSTQWLPDGPLHARLVAAGRTLGPFRAVLWQQGESDVIAKSSTEQYVQNVTKIRQAAAQAWKFDPPWLLAKSTHHPTVYDDPVGEGRIRAGVDELLKLPGFLPGPDTDQLRGENRGPVKSRRHFSAVGQRRAAQMWQTSLRQAFFNPAP